jgi:hypothetical protein
LLVQTEESTLNTKRLFVGIIKILVLVNSEFQILSCALPQTFRRDHNKEEDFPHEDIIGTGVRAIPDCLPN